MPENKYDKFRKELEFVGEGAARIGQYVDELRNEILEQEKSLENAQQQAEEARRGEKEAVEKYQKALELQKGQYAELISDVFEKPKSELVRKMKF